MTAFSDFWKKIHKTDPATRITQIDFRLNELMSEMKQKVDPTNWNVLLDEQEELEKEREELIVMTGPFKDQTDVI